MENKKDLLLLQWLKSFLPIEESDRLEREFSSKPFRITKGYQDLLEGYIVTSAAEILTVTEEIPNKDYNGLISALDVPFLAFCEHHFLPFIGKIDLVYEPSEFILGIGKLSRLIDYRTKRFVIQENIAKLLCEDLIVFGKAKGAFAKVTANHMCACFRGPKKYDSRNTVIYHSGTCSQVDRINEIQILLNN